MVSFTWLGAATRDASPTAVCCGGALVVAVRPTSKRQPGTAAVSIFMPRLVEVYCRADNAALMASTVQSTRRPNNFLPISIVFSFGTILRPLIEALPAFTRCS